MVDAVEPVPRSEISVGVEPGLRRQLRDLAGGRVLVIDWFSSRRCGGTLGALTAGFRDQRPGPEFVELAPVEGVRLFAERRLLSTLASAGPWLRSAGPRFARHLAVMLDRPERWIDFLDEPASLARRDRRPG